VAVGESQQGNRSFDGVGAAASKWSPGSRDQYFPNKGTPTILLNTRLSEFSTVLQTYKGFAAGVTHDQDKHFSTVVAV
jgi:hypothetical protein